MRAGVGKAANACCNAIHSVLPATPWCSHAPSCTSAHLQRLFPTSSSSILCAPQADFASVEYLFALSGRQPQRAVIRHTQHRTGDLRAVGQQQLYRTLLEHVIAFPFGAQRRKTAVSANSCSTAANCFNNTASTRLRSGTAMSSEARSLTA